MDSRSHFAGFVASLALAVSTTITIPRTVHAADDETVPAVEAAPSPLPQVVVVPITAAPTPVSTVTVNVNTTVSGTVSHPYEVTWSVRVRPIEPAVAPPSPSDDDPVLQGLRAGRHRPHELYEPDDDATSPVGDPPVSLRASRAVLYGGLGVLSAGGVLSVIPFFMRGSGGLVLVPLVGAFSQAAIWGAEGIATSSRELGFVSGLEVAAGLVQFAGALVATAGGASTCRAARRLAGASALAVVPGPVGGGGAGAVFTARW